jgi:hypothetical protein
LRHGIADSTGMKRGNQLFPETPLRNWQSEDKQVNDISFCTSKKISGTTKRPAHN